MGKEARRGGWGKGAALAEERDKEEGDAFWEQLLVLIVTAVISEWEDRGDLQSGGAWMSFVIRTAGKEMWAPWCDRMRHLC